MHEWSREQLIDEVRAVGKDRAMLRDQLTVARHAGAALAVIEAARLLIGNMPTIKQEAEARRALAYALERFDALADDE